MLTLDVKPPTELADQVTTSTETDPCTPRVGCVTAEFVKRDLNSLGFVLSHATSCVVHLYLIHDTHLDLLALILDAIGVFL